MLDNLGGFYSCFIDKCVCVFRICLGGEVMSLIR